MNLYADETELFSKNFVGNHYIGYYTFGLTQKYQKVGIPVLQEALALQGIVTKQGGNYSVDMCKLFASEPKKLFLVFHVTGERLESRE